eukprot:TRINITY_DN23_c1_g1_i1.p1 TRINITY_DN23_c1_g1~~TRINITY_DN23_c1_g1_i1.p1  ORF type:complete len:134 (-),score=14.67 TRINITY_DN23_c1_g1_i1:45-446(-)
MEEKRALRPAVFTTVDQLRPGTHGHNLVLKVVSSSVVVEKTRTDGTKIRIAECFVGDSTGVIIMTARNEQIDLVQGGQTIIVRNSKIDMFKGFMRLAVDKWGKVELAKEPAKFEVPTSPDKNLSIVEYELVDD